MKSRIAYQIDNSNYIIVEDGLVVMKMVHQTPDGWVLYKLENRGNFEYKAIDRDQYRHDLFERHDIRKY